MVGARTKYNEFLEGRDKVPLERVLPDLSKLLGEISGGSDIFEGFRKGVVFIVPDHSFIRVLEAHISSLVGAQPASIEVQRMSEKSYSQARAQKTVHAELQIAEHLLFNRSTMPRYIGISMHYCRTCSVCMNVLYDGNSVSYRGESSSIFRGVEIPQLVGERIAVAGVNPSALVPFRHSADETQEHDTSDSTPTEEHKRKVGVLPLTRHLLNSRRSLNAQAGGPAGATQTIEHDERLESKSEGVPASAGETLPPIEDIKIPQTPTSLTRAERDDTSTAVERLEKRDRGGRGQERR